MQSLSSPVTLALRPAPCRRTTRRCPAHVVAAGTLPWQSAPAAAASGAALALLSASPASASAQLVEQTAAGGDVGVAVAGFAAAGGLAYLLVTTDPDKR